jgi:hypothetical protein
MYKKQLKKVRKNGALKRLAGRNGIVQDLY